ncbi:MAG: HD domain-containing protein [Candidatus Omnitrophica bacterium]|nr:HD domain-containing protein [Candidatus Omnitrophota bacterium]
MSLLKRFVFFRSFRAQITATLIILMCFSGALSNLLIYEYSLKAQLNQLRGKLMIIAQAIAMSLDPQAIAEIPVNKDGVDSSQYQATEAKLLKLKELVPSLAYIYILKKTEEDNILQFVIDIHPGSYVSSVATALPGEEYDAKPYPELLKAFNGEPAADKNMITDKWGVFLSGYAPIYDKSGKTVAVLGIDMTANDVYHIEKEMERRAVFVLALGILLSALIGLIIAGRVVSPVKKLVEGTRHIASGDLRYKVGVRGSDEIRELANSFNKMGANLYRARQALLNYFYRAVQSLVRVLEARDPATKGHSDRVAQFSVAIAEKMSLPKDRIELLREAALLHDIGKLGIQEMILNKKAVLSDEDWHLIKKHPEIGEEILKPVSLDTELLAVVRGHHERYDGKGYPDGLEGEKIDILTAIVAVADSYDAMTSNRAYQKNMTKSEALEQLKANRGLQFNPKAVDAFVKVLEK